MKKQILIGLAAGLVVTGTLFFSASAQNASTAVPFQALWDAVNQVRSEIAATVANLQNQINNIQLTPGQKGEKGDTGERGIPGKNLRVVDANNKEIGLLMSAPSPRGTEIWLTDSSAFARINKKFDSVLGLVDGGVSSWGYTGRDCTGEIFVYDDGSYGSTYEIVNSPFPGYTHFAAESGLVDRVAIESMQALVSGASTCLNGTTEFAPAVRVRLIKVGPYTPPFRIIEER